MQFSVPQCAWCIHFDHLTWGCPAFLGQAIPREILLGVHNHRKPFPGDHGIRFKKKPDSDLLICVSVNNETEILLEPIIKVKGCFIGESVIIKPGQRAYGRDFEWWSRACPVVRIDRRHRAHESARFLKIFRSPNGVSQRDWPEKNWHKFNL